MSESIYDESDAMRELRAKLQADHEAELTDDEKDEDGVDYPQLRIADLLAQRGKLQDDLNTCELDNESLRAEVAELRDKLAIAEAEAKRTDDGWMRLPVDVDGEPIRLGDVMDGVGMYDTLRDVTGEVIEIAFNATDSNECVPSVALQVWSEDGKSWRRVYIDQYADVYRHHVEPRTVEDVLDEFASFVCEEDGFNQEDVKRCAEEIRELMGGAE